MTYRFAQYIPLFDGIRCLFPYNIVRHSQTSQSSSESDSQCNHPTPVTAQKPIDCLKKGIPIDFGDNHLLQVFVIGTSQTKALVGVLEGEILQLVCNNHLDVAVQYLHFLQHFFYPRLQTMPLHDCWPYLFGFELQKRKPRQCILKYGEQVDGLYIIYSGEVSVNAEPDVSLDPQEGTLKNMSCSQLLYRKSGVGGRSSLRSHYFQNKARTTPQVKPYYSKLISRGEMIGLREITSRFWKSDKKQVQPYEKQNTKQEQLAVSLTYETCSNVDLLFCPVEYIRNFFVKDSKLWFYFQQRLERLRTTLQDDLHPEGRNQIIGSALAKSSTAPSSPLKSKPDKITKIVISTSKNSPDFKENRSGLQFQTPKMHSSKQTQQKSQQTATGPVSPRYTHSRGSKSKPLRQSLQQDHVPAVANFLYACRNSRASSIKHYSNKFRYELKDCNRKLPRKTDLIYDNFELMKCRTLSSSVSCSPGQFLGDPSGANNTVKKQCNPVWKDVHRSKYCEEIKNKLRTTKKVRVQFV